MPVNFSELLDRSGRNNAFGLRCGMPGVVEAYDPTRQMVSVSMVQPEVTDDGEVLPVPVIVDVPVLWPGGGGAVMTFPLKVGDTGWLSFADRDISGWVATREQGETPDSDRLHALTDAVFEPCFSQVASNGLDVSILFGASSITISPTGVIGLSSAAGVVVTGPLTVTGPVVFNSSSVQMAGRNFLTHTHSGVQTGAGATGGVS